MTSDDTQVPVGDAQPDGGRADEGADGTLQVTRRKRFFTRRAIRHTVLCDGEPVATLRNGQTVTAAVGPGGHEVAVQSSGMDLGLTSEPVRVVVEAGGTVDLYVDVTPTSGRPKLTTAPTWS